MPSMSDFTSSKGCYGVTLIGVYRGTDAIVEGEPFVFDIDGATAFDIDRPKATTDVFAGVAAKSYPAETGARQIELYVPGSRGVRVRINGNVTAGGQGKFTYTAPTGSKVFKPSSHTVPSATGYGSCIFREAVTYSSTDPSKQSAKADLCVGIGVAPISPT